MRKKTKRGIVLLVGCFLAMINPISSISFAISEVVVFPYNPLYYWIEWFFMYGWLTILLAIGGGYLI
jgi:membrane-associated HD superfamily phosphohydrolase